jgi:hypothetical protein
VSHSIDPGAAVDQVFTTQVVRFRSAGFGIGSAVPKLQPTSVQSGSVDADAGGVECERCCTEPDPPSHS